MFARQVSLVRPVRCSEAPRVQMWIWWLWWQSNTIHSTQHYYCAELLLLLLCKVTTTTIVQSLYDYCCAELLLLLLRRARGHGVPNYFSLTKDCHDRSKATEDNEQLNNVTGKNVFGEIKHHKHLLQICCWSPSMKNLQYGAKRSFYTGIYKITLWRISTLMKNSSIFRKKNSPFAPIL